VAPVVAATVVAATVMSAGLGVVTQP